MLSEDFNTVIDSWIKDIQQYSFEQLCTNPAQNSWSLGQVCIHLIEATTHFLEQAAICITNDENAEEEMALNAKTMFLNNEFPNMLIEGPASNDDTRQPKNKEEILALFNNLKASIIDIDNQISKSKYKGKTKHPGLNYFNAAEWLQFAEMHFRHHLRQSNRIKTFLKLTISI